MVICEECGFKAKNEHGLRVHKSKTHKAPPSTTAEPLTSSSGDSKTFSSNAESGTHADETQRDKADPEAVYKCNYCHKTFTTDKGKKIHQTKSHGKDASMSSNEKDKYTKVYIHTEELSATQTYTPSSSTIDTLGSVAKPTDSLASLDTPEASDLSLSSSMLRETLLLTDAPTHALKATLEESNNTSNYIQDNGEPVHQLISPENNSNSAGQELPFKCDYCSRSFQTVRGKKTHQTKTHGKDNSLSKEETDKDKKSKQKRAQDMSCLENFQMDHQAVKTNSVDSSITNAPEYDEDYNANDGSNSDKWFPPSNQQTELPFKCDYCSQSFKTVRGKKTHQTRTHGKDNSLSKEETDKDKKSKQKRAQDMSCLENFQMDHQAVKTNSVDSSIPNAREYDEDYNASGGSNNDQLYPPSTQQKDVPFKCNFCDRSFQTEREKRNHKTRTRRQNYTRSKKLDERNNSQRNTLECTACAVKCTTYEEFTSHVCDKNQTHDHNAVKPKVNPDGIDHVETKENAKIYQMTDNSDVLSSIVAKTIEDVETSNTLPKSNSIDNETVKNEFPDLRFPCEYCTLQFDTMREITIHNLKNHTRRLVDAFLDAETNSMNPQVQHVQFEEKYQSKDDTTIVYKRRVNDFSSLYQPKYHNTDSILESNRGISRRAANRLSRQICAVKLPKSEVSLVKIVVNSLIDNFMTELKKISPEFGWDNFRSGSYYDKTKNSQPDEFDIMIYPKDIIVEVDFDTSLQVHGFYKVKSMSERTPDIFKNSVDCNAYIIPASFKKYVFGLFDQVFETIREGRRIKKRERSDDSSPAYTFDYSTIPGKQPIDIDFVPCFRIDGWPPIAKVVDPKWLKSNKVVIDALKCYDVVCKTCPNDVNEKDLLWRLSFSSAEKKLITHANDGNKCSSRKIAFKMFKGYIEDIKKTNPDKVKKFCSYHLKQFMLHQFDNWQEGERVRIQRRLLKDLIGKLTSSPPYIENYFIANDNVIRYVPDHEIQLIVEGLQEELNQLQ